MRYHPEDFINLCHAVLDDDGRLLEDECQGSVVRIKQPASDGSMEWKRFHTAHCNQVARLDIHYDPYAAVMVLDDEDESVTVVSDHPERPKLPIGEKEKEHYARVCAVDDAVGLWPRYADVVSNKSFLS